MFHGLRNKNVTEKNWIVNSKTAEINIFLLSLSAGLYSIHRLVYGSQSTIKIVPLMGEPRQRLRKKSILQDGMSWCGNARSADEI